MHKLSIFFACIAAMLLPTQAARQSGRVFPAPTGLLLLARSSDGVALAADGVQVNADGTTSQAQKIYPVGKSGAVALAGTTAFQDPVNKPVRSQVDASAVVAIWLEAHPHATVDTAERDLTQALAEKLNQYFSTRSPGANSGTYKLAIVFTGYADSKLFVKGTEFLLPAVKGKPLRAEPISGEPGTGDIWAFGAIRVEQELMSGSSASLKKFNAEPALQKVRSAQSRSASSADYINAFDTMLRAAESTEGKKLAASIVAAPNKFATISAKDGFAWSQPQ